MAPATVTELGSSTGLRQANISNHLARLRDEGLVKANRRGRLIEYRLADATVAQLVESVSVLVGPTSGSGRDRLSEARTCYDHLAGRLGVELLDGLLAAKALRDDAGGAGLLQFGPRASQVFSALGVDIDEIAPSRRRLAFRCLDWTEHRDHVGGALGAELATAFLARGLVVRPQRGGRQLEVAPATWRRIHSLSYRRRP